MENETTHDRPFGQRPNGSMTISFFSAAAATVCQAVLDWAGEIGSRKYAHYVPLTSKWHHFLGDYTASPIRNIIVPTRGEWCAFIDNDPSGSMPSSELLVIPERLGICSVSFVMDDWRRRKKERTSYAAMFRYCDARRGKRGEGAIERYIGIVWNGGGTCGTWECHESGVPLPFEEVDAYKCNVTCDRLTPQMLIRYARALDIYLDEADSFYDLSKAIGLSWIWSQSDEESTDVVLEVAEAINKGRGGTWIPRLFRGQS